MSSLRSLYPSLSRAVIESRDYYDYLLPPQKLLLEENKQINQIKKILESTPELKNKRDTLDYITYLNGYEPMPMKLIVQMAETTEDRMTNVNAIYLDAYNNFKILVDWLNESKIFDTIGTIVIYVSPAGSSTSIHRDFEPDVNFKKSQGIWINPFNRKKFFVLDEEFNKQYFQGDVNIFELHSWHGSEVSKCDTFTIRVDGYFSEEFLNTTNLKEYYYG
jgi:hypothetical protein